MALRLPPSRLVLAVLLCGAGACATARGPGPAGDPVLLSHQPPPAGRRCQPSPQPEVLPRADALVDSAALLAELAPLARAHRLDAGYAVLSVEHDRNGWNARREVIEHDLPAEAADSLQRLVFAHRRTLPPGDPVGVRLRVDLGEDPALRVGRQLVCPPRLVDTSGLALDEGMWSIQSAEGTTHSWSTVWVRVLVDEWGGIADARLERSPMQARSEAALHTLLHSLTFQPALVDGAPVARWTRVAIPAPW